MVYRIIDGQGAGMREGLRFNTLEEVRDSLRSFHAQDVEGAEKMTLADLCEMGVWSVEGECSAQGCNEWRVIDGSERYLNGHVLCDTHAHLVDNK